MVSSVGGANTGNVAGLRCTTSTFKTSDGKELFVREWCAEPEVPTRAVLHVAHGLSEHGGRYAGLANALVRHGIVVVAHDHRGHGRTANSPVVIIDEVEAPHGALRRMAADLRELLDATKAAHPGCKVFLFGHSMGSIVSQICAGSGAPIDGMMLSGPSGRPPAVSLFGLRSLLSVLIAMYGTKAVSSITSKLTFDKFNKKATAAAGLKVPVTDYDWLSRDADQVQKYVDDPMCGQDVSLGIWRSFGDTFSQLRDPNTFLASMRSDLPVGIICGSADYAAINDLGTLACDSIQAEHRAAFKAPPKIWVYPGARHELLLETNKEQVLSDVTGFFLSILDGTVRMTSASSKL
eukprot:TRINITY_DN12139_c0_g1_i1.p1 TRINITY_DN12139_c0_g1~~TRINITY_DN12139_c0_g1_i1.p1  ORF type:complete len:350 (-),score=42.15 TRINITY_DN12139_c0_g1_i1:78-1127(-)